MTAEQGLTPENTASGELDRLVEERAESVGIDRDLLWLWRELGCLPTGRTRDRFSADDLDRWEQVVAHPDSPGPERADLSDLVELLSEDLAAALAATLTTRSPAPARRFAARVAETDLLVSLEDGSDRREAETLGATVSFLLLAGWTALAVADQSDVDAAAEAVAAVHDGIGPKCAELASAAAALISGAGTVGADDLGEELLPALLLLLAGVVLRYGEGAPGFAHRCGRSHHEDTTTR